MKKIFLIFGDSITHGAWDKKGGWASHLRRFLDKRMVPKTRTVNVIYNLSVSSGTTEDLLRRFTVEAESRFRKGRTTIVFATGGNDAIWTESQQTNQVKLEKSANNFRELVRLAKKFTDEIIFIGLTPVDEKRTNPLSWDSDLFCRNEYIQKYDQEIKSVCQENKILFVDIFDEFVKLNYKKLLIDGLHPNTKGQKKMFKIIKNFLEKNKIV